MSDNQFPLVCLLAIASIIEFAVAADYCSQKSCTGRIGFGIACGIISAIASGLLAFLFYSGRRETAVQFGVPISLVLLVFWSVANGLNTSVDQAFGSIGNGYISSWIAFFATAYLAYVSTPLFKVSESGRNSDGLVIVLCASFIELAVSINMCSNAGCHGKYGWAVAVGVISSVCCLVVLILIKVNINLATDISAYFAIFLLLLWICGVASNTSINGPFEEPCYIIDTETGIKGSANGYLSSWIAFIFSCFYCFNLVGGDKAGLSMSAGGQNQDQNGYSNIDDDDEPLQ